MAHTRTLRRRRHGRILGGVCIGLADYFGVSASFVRLLFILSCALPGPQTVLYILLWQLVPLED
ncbi:PspC domain-containing protein [Nanchangia anserum]|uniref:PspC domain-containing protein n=1 Tax=Nanchangia anserum TaxID=2692125 RepID=UPI001884564A|nr:PspC domain-containing protein [Nanchangia anserum]